ncbi:MAG: methyltransferase domain-containing protein [Chloroflexota bacterium]
MSQAEGLAIDTGLDGSAERLKRKSSSEDWRQSVAASCGNNKIVRCRGALPKVCRFCGQTVKQILIDLGMSPLANSYLSSDQLDQMEPFYPLRVYVCGDCLLVQAEEFESPESIFFDYPYFASYSNTWLQHAKTYADMATRRFRLRNDSLVIEIASNDGYLLQYFSANGIPVLGIEPAANVAGVAAKKGIPTMVRFFGEEAARDLVAKGMMADLLVGNNVLAHVVRPNDFVRGMKTVLKAGGVITMEFPHLMRLMQENQFDTIYHEHFSYFSFIVVEKIFAAHGLTLFDVEEVPTHGGSLRIYARHIEDTSKPVEQRVVNLRIRETEAGFTSLQRYLSFADKVKATKYKLLKFLIEAKCDQKAIVGYGAPAKGNTLLNYCGIGPDLIDYTVDRNPYKEGHFLPGTHIPIYHPDRIRETKPDYVLILPWNLKDEVMEQMHFVRDWGGRFLVPIPELKVL